MTTFDLDNYFDEEDKESSAAEETKDEKNTDHLFKKGVSGNPKGRPKGSGRQVPSLKINDDDREYFGTDSRRFLERALLKASTWEEGLKIAKELKTLQHASLQSIQTKTEKTNVLTLRWSTPEEIASNDKKLIEADYVDLDKKPKGK